MQKEEEYILLQRIIKGETILFSYFVERYSEPLINLIKGIVLSQVEAEEITQDVFLKAFNKLKTFKGKSSFSTWLFRIAYNSAISEIRKSKIEYVVDKESIISDFTDSAVDELLDNDNDEEVLLELEKAIHELDIEDKTLIKLYYYQEKSIKEIAYIFNISFSNVKIKLFRVRKKIYNLVENNRNEKR